MKNCKCGGCGKEATTPEKPNDWYSREDEDGKQFACSRKCIDIVSSNTGKTRVILPW